jgi:sugar lactone lactonase YvrE
MHVRTFALVAGLCASAPACTQNRSSFKPSVRTGQPPRAELVRRFDPAAGELPEGLAMGDDAAFVGFAPTARVARLDLRTGEATAFGRLPAPVPGKGFMTGLARSAAGDLFACLVSFGPEVQSGIYRIPSEGGVARLFAEDDALSFPNALAFDRDGALFATDSASGSVFRIAAEGRAERWATGEALRGDKDACGGKGPGFAIGANGLVVARDAVYVVNLDKATLVEIERSPSGAAGAVRTLAGPDCDALGGADGLVRAADGSFVIAVNRQNKIVRVGANGVVSTILSGFPLDFPATLAYEGPTLYATNFAFMSARAGKPAMPGLVKLTLPGLQP